MAIDPPSDRSRAGLLASVRTHLLMIVICAVVGALAGYLGSGLLPTTYTAEAAIYLGARAPFTPVENSGDDAERFGADQAELVLTSEVLQPSGARLDPPLPVDEVRASVQAAASAVTSSIVLTVERPEAEQARDLANAVIEAYRDSAARRVDDLVSAAIAVDSDPTLARDVGLRAAAYGDGVVAVEPAVLPQSASAPLPLQNALLMALLGLLVGTGVAVVGDQRQARRATVADLDLLLGAPLVTRFNAPASASVSDMVDLDPMSDGLRSGHDVLTAVDVALENQSNPSVLVLSWQRALTTTSLVVSVALAAARAGRKVVVIDGGLKERGVSALTDVDPGAGLEALASPEAPIRSSVRTWRMGEDEVDVVPVDGWSPTPTGAAARPQVLRAAIARLQHTAELTLVDGPPLTERSLGLALGRGVDGVILVVDEETSVDDAHEMGRRIALAGAEVLGYVLAGPATRGPVRMSWSPRRPWEGPLSLRAGRTTPRR